MPPFGSQEWSVRVTLRRARLIKKARHRCVHTPATVIIIRNSDTTKPRANTLALSMSNNHITRFYYEGGRSMVFMSGIPVCLSVKTLAGFDFPVEYVVTPDGLNPFHQNNQ